MSSFVFLVPLISLGICFMPVHLLRRKTTRRAQDYFVSSDYTEWNVIQNSSIAYSLKMAMFVPLFAWGASGDLWPAIIMAVSFLLGLHLVRILHRPLLEFLDSALHRDRSITISAFVARQHGNDPRVGLLGAGLTIIALGGLIVVEALAVAAILKPIMAGDAGSTHLAIFGFLLLMAFYTMLAGNFGVMHSTQLQLGMLYLGLFFSTALLLYLQASEVRSVPPHGTLAALFIAVYCVVMPIYRRIRYVDTGPVGGMNSSTDDTDFDGKGFGAKTLRMLEKILNVTISVFSGLAAGLAILELYTEGFPAIGQNVTAALRTGTSLSGLALTALFLQPLLYPIVDITNWQRIAAYEKDRSSLDVEPGGRAAAFTGFWRLYAAESPLMWLLLCMFGAVAVVSTAVPGGPGALGNFVKELAAQPDLVSASAMSLFLVSVLAMALSTMNSLFSASLAAVRYDVLPAIWPEPASIQAQALDIGLARAPGAAAQAELTEVEARARWRTVAAGAGLTVAIAAAYYVAGEYLQVTLTSSAFLALLFAFSCIQLAFVPLVLGPLIARPDARSGTVSPRMGARHSRSRRRCRRSRRRNLPRDGKRAMAMGRRSGLSRVRRSALCACADLARKGWRSGVDARSRARTDKHGIRSPARVRSGRTSRSPFP